MKKRYKIVESNNIRYGGGELGYGLDEHGTMDYWKRIHEINTTTYESKKDAKEVMRETKMDCRLGEGFPPIPTEDSICELELQEVDGDGKIIDIIERRSSWYSTESANSPLEVDYK